jgi:hypothetical protein
LVFVGEGIFGFAERMPEQRHDGIVLIFEQLKIRHRGRLSAARREKNVSSDRGSETFSKKSDEFVKKAAPRGAALCVRFAGYGLGAALRASRAMPAPVLSNIVASHQRPQK